MLKRYSVACRYVSPGLHDPNLAMVEVRVTSAEYWDAPSSTMVQLYGMAKSMLTGEPPTDVGDHGSIRMR